MIFFDKSPLATAIVSSAMLVHLRGEVRGHRVDALGEVFPHAGHAADLRLAAKLALGADLAGDAGHLRGEHVELLDHRVDDLGGAQELAFQRPAVDVEAHRAQKIALGDGGDGAGDFRGRPEQIVDQRIDRSFHLAPGAVRQAKAGARCRVLPSRPTTWPTRSTCLAMRRLVATISLKVSAILPMMPMRSPAMRTEKSPTRIACSACSNSANPRASPSRPFSAE